MDTQEIKKRLETKLKIQIFKFENQDKYYGSKEHDSDSNEIWDLLVLLGYDFDTEAYVTMKMDPVEINQYVLRWIGVEVGGETKPVKKEFNIPVIMIMIVIWFCLLWLGLVLIPNWLEHR